MTSNVRVLVVDDSQAMRRNVKKMLTQHGRYAIQEGFDGEDGLQKALADPPDLLLIDLEMPVLNGDEVIDAIQEKSLDIPIILMTSHGSEAIAVDLFRKGVKDYLIKPIQADELQVAVDRALTEVRLRRERDELTRNLVQANHELEHRVRELNTLYRVGKSVTSLLSREQLLKRILDAVFYLTRVEEASIILIDEEDQETQIELHRQIDSGEISPGTKRMIQALCEKALNRKTTVSKDAVVATPLMIGDNVVGLLYFGNRVSEKPLGEHDQQLLLALGDYAAIALENARLYENVRRADQAKSEFVSVVAHELKQPITAIRGYVDLLQKGKVGSLNEQQISFVDIIRDSTNRMRVLITDLQDISRMETGQMHLEAEPTELTPLVEEVVKEIRSQLEKKNQSITVNLPEDIPLVMADPARLSQILLNLLSNAHKYTPEQGRIRVRSWSRDGYVHCAVSDNGIGIDKEAQGTEEVQGTGLGLCVVKNLVELQGGSIEVKSEPQKGSTFAFTIPIADSQGDETGSDSAGD
jgi:signal transduction histidine kinase/FixJ family two-component response regulator